VSPSHLVPVVRRRVLHVVLVAVQLLRALHLRLQLGRLRLLVRLVLGLQRRRLLLLLLRLLVLLLLLLRLRLRLRLRLGLRLRLRLRLGLRLRLRLRLRRLLRLLLQLQLQRLLLPLLGLLLTRLVRLLGAERAKLVGVAAGLRHACAPAGPGADAQVRRNTRGAWLVGLEQRRRARSARQRRQPPHAGGMRVCAGRKHGSLCGRGPSGSLTPLRGSAPPPGTGKDTPGPCPGSAPFPAPAYPSGPPSAHPPPAVSPPQADTRSLRAKAAAQVHSSRAPFGRPCSAPSLLLS